jgi:hypothetical protein
MRLIIFLVVLSMVAYSTCRPADNSYEEDTEPESYEEATQPEASSSSSDSEFSEENHLSADGTDGSDKNLLGSNKN